MLLELICIEKLQQERYLEVSLLSEGSQSKSINLTILMRESGPCTLDGGGLGLERHQPGQNHQLTKMFPNSISTGRIQLRMNSLAHICVILIIPTVECELQFTRTGNTKNIYSLTY